MSRSTWLLAVLPIVLCQCSFNVVSPPSRLANTELPRVADSGHVVVAPQGFGAGKIFGPALAAASIRISKGMGHGEEWSVSPVFGLVDESDQVAGNPVPYFGGIGVEYKSEFPLSTDWLIASHHWGGGLLMSGAGQVVSGEAGVSIGTRVWYLRPFLSGTTWLGLPLATRDIRYEDDASGFETKRLTSTLGLRGDLGLELYLGRQVSLIMAGGAGVAKSETDDLPFIELGASLRTEF
jgi:hypothetical protein